MDVVRATRDELEKHIELMLRCGVEVKYHDVSHELLRILGRTVSGTAIVMPKLLRGIDPVLKDHISLPYGRFMVGLPRLIEKRGKLSGVYVTDLESQVMRLAGNPAPEQVDVRIPKIPGVTASTQTKVIYDGNQESLDAYLKSCTKIEQITRITILKDKF